LQQSAATQTPLKTAGGDDVMARIDQLLGKLDEDNDAATAQSAPPANDQTASTETADEATADMQDDDPARSELVVDDPVQDEPVQSDPVQNDSVQALNDIAAAIHQAQQSQIDGDASPADPDLTPALDMAVLSATIADEVRHSVSAMIAAEMPQMVRQAVVEAIREMPTAAPGQPTPKAARKTRAKPSSANKTPATKTTAKETTGKKAVTKKATAKKAAS
jgi:ribonuclease E